MRIWATILLLIIYAALLMSSCTPERKAQRQLKKAQRHLIKAEQLDPSVKQVQTDTVVFTEVRTDTVFQSLAGDTVEITKDKLHIKYVELPGDSVYIEGECAADTVIINNPVFVQKEVPTKLETFVRRKWWVLLLILATIIGLKKLVN